MSTEQSKDLELILAQQRIIIQQNDKILEFVSAIHEGLVNLSEEEEDAPDDLPEVTQANVAEVLSRLAEPEKKDARTPGFGYEAHLARGGE